MKRSPTRALLIHTASQLFYKNGYNLTGINEIIAVAGVAKATLYSHFKSKEDLCLAYLDAKDEELIENISRFVQTKPVGEERLLAVLTFLVSFFDSGHFNGCWCIRTVAEIPKDNQRIRHKIRANKNTFLQFIQSLVVENKPDSTATAQQKLAKRIYLLYESSVAESHLQGDAWPILENIELLKSILSPKK